LAEGEGPATLFIDETFRPKWLGAWSCHISTTDPEARLFRKGLGKEARLCFMGHALMENRNGLIVGVVTTSEIIPSIIPGERFEASCFPRPSRPVWPFSVRRCSGWG
jgi:hypothetical protein